MKRLKLILASAAFIVLGSTAVLVPASPVGAVNALGDACNQSNSGDNPICQNTDDNANDLIGTLINVLLFVIGTLAVVMIIWGGIMYTTSAGDAGRVKKAKDTLTYSIVGLVVAFLAYAIVNWVLRIFQ